MRDIRWRSTLIETRNWETVVIPNSMLMKARVAILGRREGSPLQWRRMLDFMVDPGVPPARVIAIVDDEMRELAIPNVARTPAPSCVLNGFEEGNLRYQLRYFLTDLLEDDVTDSMVRVHLFASLQRAGIRVAEPQRTVHAVQRDEAHAETVRRRELTRRLQALRQRAACSPRCPRRSKADIAERLQYAPFARGDVITKQGNKAHWLYILAFGEAEVLFEPPSGSAAGHRRGARRRSSSARWRCSPATRAPPRWSRRPTSSATASTAPRSRSCCSARPEIAEEIAARHRRAARRPRTARARRSRGARAEAEAEVRLATKIRRFFGMRS